MEFTFTLRYQVDDGASDPAALVERLGEAGCTDSTAGIGQPGRLALEFSREAESAEEALCTALADVKRAIPAARLVEAAPDFVGLSDVAEIAGVSRQNMRKLMLSYPESFPAPVHEGSTSLWHLADLLDWLRARGAYDIDPRVQEIATSTLKLNLAVNFQRFPARDQRRLDPLLGRLRP